MQKTAILKMRKCKTMFCGHILQIFHSLKINKNRKIETKQQFKKISLLLKARR